MTDAYMSANYNFALLLRNSLVISLRLQVKIASLLSHDSTSYGEQQQQQ